MGSKSGFNSIGCESYVGFVTISGGTFCFVDDIVCDAFLWQGAVFFPTVTSASFVLF